MSGEYRFDVEAVLERGCERVLGGGVMPLVTLRLFNGPGVVDAATGRPTRRPAVFTDLQPAQARELAAELLWCARLADSVGQHEGDR